MQKPGAAIRPETTFEPLPEYLVDEPVPYSVVTILFAVLVVLANILWVYQLRGYSRLYEGAEWKLLTNTTSTLYVSSLEPLFFLEWLIKVLAIFASALLIIPFLRKAYAFLRWVRVYLVANLIFLPIEGWAGLGIESTLKGKQLGTAFDPYPAQLYWYLGLYGLAILVTLISLGYFTLSKRVGKTFIN